jgi:hypothetical protein
MSLLVYTCGPIRKQVYNVHILCSLQFITKKNKSYNQSNGTHKVVFCKFYLFLRTAVCTERLDDAAGLGSALQSSSFQPYYGPGADSAWNKKRLS